MSLVRALAVGALVYTVLVVAYVSCWRARLARRRRGWKAALTLVAGSTLYGVILSSGITFLDVIWMIAGAVGLLVIVTRAPAAARQTGTRPTLLMHRGLFLGTAMRQARVEESMVLAAIRASGAAMEEVVAVIVNPDGTFGVVRDPGVRSNAAASGISPSAAGPTIWN